MPRVALVLLARTISSASGPIRPPWAPSHQHRMPIRAKASSTTARAIDPCGRTRQHRAQRGPHLRGSMPGFLRVPIWPGRYGRDHGWGHRERRGTFQAGKAFAGASRHVAGGGGVARPDCQADPMWVCGSRLSGRGEGRACCRADAKVQVRAAFRVPQRLMRVSSAAFCPLRRPLFSKHDMGRVLALHLLFVRLCSFVCLCSSSCPSVFSIS